MNEVLKKITEYIVKNQGAEIVEEIFGPHYQSVRNGTIPVVMFGAGSSGKHLCPVFIRHDIHPVGFCDNDISRVGGMFCDLPIFPFDELQKKHRKSLIVITSTAYQGFIEKQLLGEGFQADRIILLDTKETSFDKMLKRERILMLARNGEPETFMNNLQADAEKLEEAYTLFADQKSKDIFVRRIALVASGYDYCMYKEYLTEFSEPILMYGYNNYERLRKGGTCLYFDNDILTLQDQEVLVDGGAYTGDSAEEFIKVCRKKHLHYKAIYCFEPDRGNFEKLRETTARYRDIECLPFGLWSHRTTLKFVSSARTESYGARIQEPGSTTYGTADIEINTAGIDEHFSGSEVTCIKMDIEGAEFEAIRGATDTIKQYAPKLAISVYHRKSDIYEIPLLVKEILPDYKLYLRHLGNYFDDTILFAAV